MKNPNKVILLLRSVYLKGQVDANMKISDLSWEDKILSQLEAYYKPKGGNVNKEELLGVLARGYCTKRNSQKVLDPDLIQDMAKEVEKLATPLEPIDENREKLDKSKDVGSPMSLKEER